MKETDRDFLLKQLQSSRDVLDKFFDFKVSTAVQLLNIQLQYFQSLGGIALAIVAILVGTKSISLTLPWFLTGLTSLTLVVFVSTNIRETIDAKDKDLQDTETSLEGMDAEMNKIILNALKLDDYSIYESFIKERQKSDSAPESKAQFYAGEIAVFLFLSTIFFGIVAILNAYMSMPFISMSLLLSSGVLFCFVAAISDWNLSLTRKISNVLDRYFHK